MVEVKESKTRRPRGQGLAVSFAARWTKEELEEIRQRANTAGLSVSEYVKRCALGVIDVSPSALEARLVALEDRIGRLEARAEASTW